MGNLYIGLIHYPVLNQRGEVATAALTGLDVHDIARAAKTYGVQRYFIVTPVPAQQGIAARIRRYWLETKAGHNRGEALELVEILGSYEESLEWIKREEGGVRPLLIGTSARQLQLRLLTYEELRARLESSPQPVYILFGTGWGLADELLGELDYLLPPLLGPGEWNHLSVRTAAAIVLDRLRGRRS
ncbi:MAG: RNA methyltransferase [Candidatus Methylomirabilales bacterium]